MASTFLQLPWKKGDLCSVIKRISPTTLTSHKHPRPLIIREKWEKITYLSIFLAISKYLKGWHFRRQLSQTSGWHFVWGSRWKAFESYQADFLPISEQKTAGRTTADLKFCWEPPHLLQRPHGDLGWFWDPGILKGYLRDPHPRNLLATVVFKRNGSEWFWEREAGVNEHLRIHWEGKTKQDRQVFEEGNAGVGAHLWLNSDVQ